MIIATFGPATEWAGKTIAREGDVFVLEDHGPITAADVMEYDRQGHLLWASDGIRTWVKSLATREGVVLSGALCVSGMRAFGSNPHKWNLIFRPDEIVLSECDGQTQRIPCEQVMALEVLGRGTDNIGDGFRLEGAAHETDTSGLSVLHLFAQGQSYTALSLQANSGDWVFNVSDGETPDELRERLSAIFVALRKVHAHRTSPGSGADGTAAVDQLERLARLHQSGEITDDEFAAFKAKLME